MLLDVELTFPEAALLLTSGSAARRHGSLGMGDGGQGPVGARLRLAEL